MHIANIHVPFEKVVFYVSEEPGAMLRPVYNAHCTMLYYTNKGHMHTPEFLTSWGASCVKMAFRE
jgi:hypothetical protein